MKGCKINSTRQTGLNFWRNFQKPTLHFDARPDSRKYFLPPSLIAPKNSKLLSFQEKRFAREKTEDVEAEQETQAPIRNEKRFGQSEARNRTPVSHAPSSEGELSDLCQGMVKLKSFSTGRLLFPTIPT